VPCENCFLFNWKLHELEIIVPFPRCAIQQSLPSSHDKPWEDMIHLKDSEKAYKRCTSEILCNQALNIYKSYKTTIFKFGPYSKIVFFHLCFLLQSSFLKFLKSCCWPLWGPILSLYVHLYPMKIIRKWFSYQFLCIFCKLVQKNWRGKVVHLKLLLNLP